MHKTQTFKSRFIQTNIRYSNGFSLIELVIVVSIVGVILSMGVSSLNSWSKRQRVSNSAGEIVQLLFVGRSEAIRKSSNHLIFFDTDLSGSPLLSEDGSTLLAALLIEDTNGNYLPDSGEHRMSIPFSDLTGISWGRSQANELVPTEGGTLMGDPFSGTSVENTAQEVNSAGNFRHPTDSSTVQSWVLLAPDGTPRAFHPSASTAVADVGTGDGAVYLNDGERDHAIVMTSLGSVRGFRWDASAGLWK